MRDSGAHNLPCPGFKCGETLEPEWAAVLLQEACQGSVSVSTLPSTPVTVASVGVGAGVGAGIRAGTGMVSLIPRTAPETPSTPQRSETGREAGSVSGSPSDGPAAPSPSSSRSLVQRWREQRMRHVVDCSKQLKWCPHDSCELVVHMVDDRALASPWGVLTSSRGTPITAGGYGQSFLLMILANI